MNGWIWFAIDLALYVLALGLMSDALAGNPWQWWTLVPILAAVHISGYTQGITRQ